MKLIEPALELESEFFEMVEEFKAEGTDILNLTDFFIMNLRGY